MIEGLDMSALTEALALGGVGFVAGCLLPFGFWMIGAVIDVARKFSK